MKTKINFALLSILFIFSILGCDSRFNEQVMYGTVGSKLEKIAPGEVKIRGVESKSNTVSLLWENPIDKDLYGVKISVSVADKSGNPKIPKPITLTADNVEDIPNIYTFYELTEKTQYTFTIQTFDKNLNFSSGTTTTETPTDKNNNVPKISEDTIMFKPGYDYITISWKNNDPTNTLLGVTISCRNTRTNDVSTVSLPRDNSTNTLPTTYTFNNLINGDQYTFTLYQYDNEYRSDGTPSSCTANKKNNMKIIDLDTNNLDSSTILSWTNPSDDDFYGIQIKCEPAEGNLSSPIYFMKKEYPIIPSSFTAIGLTNNKLYKFSISTLDSEMILGSENNITAKPNPTSNKQEVQNFKAVPGNGYVDLFWKLPEDTSLLEKYELRISPGLQTIPLTNISQTSYRANGLTNGTSYSFTLRTIDISGNYSTGSDTEARPDTGSSGIFDHPDLFRYKNSCYAYDFGYCSEPTEKSFTFTSITQMNLANNPVSFVMGTSEVYSVVSAKNITGDSYGQTQVNPGDEFEIVIRYNPKNYDGTQTTASWDEANIIIGNTVDNTIRVIGSNYPQPKSISNNDNKLRMWLRADLISDDDLTGKGAKKDTVMKLPDYSGNNFHAYNMDKSYNIAPKYIKNNEAFNNLPVVDFSASTTSQLISTGSPIVDGANGHTTFIVFKFGPRNDGAQSIINSNYGTSFPTLYTSTRYYNDSGYYISGDYKIGIAVRGQGLTGDLRWACITNDITNNDNSLLVLNAPSGASGVNSNEYIYSKPVSTCLIFDAQKDSKKVETGRIENYPFDFNSNIRMWLSGTERLLAYFDSQSSTTHLLSTNSNALKTLCTQESSYLLRTNGLQTYGVYGKPWGDGKGHRYGSLSDIKKPGSISEGTYEDWRIAAEQAGGLRQSRVSVKSNDTDNTYLQREYKRMYDSAMYYNPPAAISNASDSGNKTDTSATSWSDHFTNWIAPDQYKNGTLNIITLGANLNQCNYSQAQIAEVFIFEGALSEEDIKAMNNYMKYRYKLPEISDDPTRYLINNN